MYRRILVPVENSPYDAAIITHVGELAKLHGSSIVIAGLNIKLLVDFVL